MPFRLTDLAGLLYFVVIALAALHAIPETPELDEAFGAGPTPSPAARSALLLERVTVIDGTLRVAPSTDSTSLSDRSRDPVAEAYSLLHRGARVDALGVLLDAASASALSGSGWVLLGHQLQRTGATEAALAAWREAVEHDSIYRADLAKGLGRLGQHADAATIWRQIVESPGDLDPAAARGRLAVASHLAGTPVEAAWLADAPPVLRAIVTSGQPPRAGVRTLGRSAAAAAGLDVGDPIRVDAGGGAELSEPSIVTSGNTVVVGWNDLRRPDGLWTLGSGVSIDGGQTWGDSLFLPPMPNDTAQLGDPMTAVDPRTGSLWLGAIEFAASDSRVYVARESSGALGPPVVVASGSAFDKCWMAAGPAPSSPATTHLYVGFSFPSSLHVSSDLGASWSARRALDANGLGFHPRVGPNGELHIGYFEYTDFVEGSGILLQTSLDGGTTIGLPTVAANRMDVWFLQDGSRFPGDFRVPIIPIWAVSPVDGTIYVVYSDTTNVVMGDANVDIYFSRSSDGGATWSTPTVVHGDGTPPGDQFLSWLEVDGSGRLHLVFFDSRHTPQADDVTDARLDVTYAWSEDGGSSWSETRITPSSFGTGQVDWPILGQFIGDYLGLTVVDDGVVLIAYPKTSGADLDLFVQRIEHTGVFDDGFESGTLDAWSSSTL